ncbi:DNA processing protein [Nocardioides cavernae]|uniref:DNA processing protein n=1 Tax=Nocardioides cavernae TaxID=1921566 RepID=A0A7Y9GZ02_9ACTN|nr:DNA-processing protein DprA [Nocardioides cavernae]NYE34913.1 DNA processing protein [Nocardioides cavernae]
MTATSDVPDADRLARVALSCAVEPGDLVTSRLVADVGPRKALESQLEPKARSSLHERLREVDPERQLELAARAGIRFLVPGDPEWPRGLDDLDHVEPARTGDDGESPCFGGTPPGLWVRGPLALTDLTGSVAVVGSRAASVYGVEVTRGICGQLALARRPVVSGGARGIDFVAHDATLRSGGVSVAVLACGVDQVYPEHNRPLLAHLAAEHAVVSEQPPGSRPTRLRFLARNRLIAAMTRGTVLVEAALRSGALNTVRWADQLSRPVMCVPGPVTSYTSAGAHLWLRGGGAILVTGGADVLEVVGRPGEHLVEPPRGPERPRDGLRGVERTVLEQVPAGEAVDADAIARRSLVHVRDTVRALERLHHKGYVTRVVGGWRLAPGAG